VRHALIDSEALLNIRELIGPAARNQFCMIVKYSDVLLMALEPVSFTDKLGVEVEYNKAYFRMSDDDGITKVMQFNTKLPLASAEGETGKLSVDIDESGRNKPKVLKFEVEK